MAVFTPVSLDELKPWMKQFPLGDVAGVRGISSGIENSNFFIQTQKGEFVLTIFERLSFEQLPFYLNLMRHLSQRGVLIPAPVANNDGKILHELRGKPAAIVTKLQGDWIRNPNPNHCAQVGAMLAKMHLAGRDFDIFQPNLRGLEWKRETAPTVMKYLSEENRALLTEEMRFQEEFAQGETYKSLQTGPVHADLFRNNVMFDKDKLTGFFDFYFAGYDTWIFDVAVTVNDWCIDLDSGELDEARVLALLDAYREIRPFTPSEQKAWRPILRSAALRFWLSRLYDFYLPREAQMLTPHDPSHFERVLRARIKSPVPELTL